MKILKGKSITDVPGFKAAGVSSGIKKSGKKDLCIIYTETPAVAAATFTTNLVKAAPLLVNEKHMKSDIFHGIVVNSGNANACTGEQGLKDAETMAGAVAQHLGIPTQSVLVSSTGIIGVPLPMEAVTAGIEEACGKLSSEGGFDAADAIMTTDTFSKSVTIQIDINNKPIYISGIAKGSGMIHPNMATMLSFLVSNVKISKALLAKALTDSVEQTYNMISVDGDTSTNDMVIMLANGTADNPILNQEDEDYLLFKSALDYVNKELAKLIAKDGEGATKLIEATVLHAQSLQDARLCAKAVISSSLVKSAFFGSDANWGRILCAMGYSKGVFDPAKVSIAFANTKGFVDLVKNGIAVAFSEEKAKEILLEDYINIIIDLKDGENNATAWGCDLSYDYVKINGSYRN